jgi:nitroreductase
LGRLTGLDVMEAVRTRRSIRRYQRRPVPEDVLRQVLNSARLAPSANNSQPWRIVVVRDDETKAKLATASHGQKFMATAPLVLVACGVPDEAFEFAGGYMSSHVIDVSIALDHLTLAAHSLGLGTCWIAWFDEDKVRRLLGIPEDVRVVAMTPVGYPDEAPERTPRRNLEELVMFDRYQ